MYIMFLWSRNTIDISLYLWKQYLNTRMVSNETFKSLDHNVTIKAANKVFWVVVWYREGYSAEALRQRQDNEGESSSFNLRIRI